MSLKQCADRPEHAVAPDEGHHDERDQGQRPQPIQDRINAEIQDNFDEDYELELEDSDLADLLSEGNELPERHAFPRKLYFTELLRLQRELIKLQDWVVANKLKLVVLFEGRDAAGKGGVIKRITQRLNPRVVRAVALPAPGEREKPQWYFQRYVPHLPAGGEIVLFDRSWYNRAGVERVMGFCTDEEYEDFFRSVPEFEKLIGPVGHRAGEVLVLDLRRGAEHPLPHPHQRPVEAVEAFADGPRVRAAAGRTTPRRRRSCSSAPTFRRRRGT